MNGENPEHEGPRESGEDSEDESEILEESPCGRWLKRREEVEQRDVPGIDCAYLAMDTEEGVEVVWNEVQFSERKNFKLQEDKIQQVFENLTQLEHPNIVKFHRYWTDTHNDKPRVIFITEYMSSGSLKQFLKKTKRNLKKLPLPAWKRWCTQILSALSYLHSCNPSIIHGNLTCDTIFIQHNGLVKIGSVAPDAIHHHVKTYRENMKNMHFIAPEYGTASLVTPAVDIYSFGMCALEMAALEIQGNGDSGCNVTDEQIQKTIESLEDNKQKDLVRQCLCKDVMLRPSARQLLLHPLLFDVHPLKLLAAHVFVKTAGNSSESLPEEVLQQHDSDTVFAEILYRDGRNPTRVCFGDLPHSERIGKYVEDVKYGIYPLTAFLASQPPRTRAASPEVPESVKSMSPEPMDVESRRVVTMMCSIKPREETATTEMQDHRQLKHSTDDDPVEDRKRLYMCYISELCKHRDFRQLDLFKLCPQMTILLRMDDKMNRQLTCSIAECDTSLGLSQELVRYGFINEADRDKIGELIEEQLRSHFAR